MDTVQSRARLTLAVVSAAVFMLLLDVTIVSVALADLRRDLGAGLSDLQWVVDAYTLALAGLLLTAATLGDRMGRKRVFIAGLAVFTAASLACALAQDVTALDAARVVQGVGGALLFGTAVPLLGAAFPDPAARSRAIGVFGATLAAATAVGPLVGGALVDGPGWRWIFLVNVPVGVVALLASLRLVESRPEQAHRLDLPGAALLSGSLFALLVALIRGNDDGWTSAPILALFAAAAVLFAGFVGRERLAADPMVDLALFGRPAFTAVGLSAFAVSATIIAATYYLALYLQTSAGFSPFDTGVRVLPLTVASFVAAPLAAVAVRRVGTAVPLVVSLALSGAGMLAMAFLDAGDSWTVLIPGFVVAGIGLGIQSAASVTAALEAVPVARAGMATGSVNTLRQVGTAAGVAALGALFQHRATAVATDGLAALHLPAQAVSRLAEGVGSGGGRLVVQGLPGQLHPVAGRVADVAAYASARALDAVMLWGGVAALACAAVTALLLVAGRRRPAPEASEPSEPSEPDADDLLAAVHLG